MSASPTMKFPFIRTISLTATLLLTTLLSGCQSDSDSEDDGTAIWNDQSQGFNFEIIGGHTGNGTSPDHTLDTLSEDVLVHLKSMRTTTETSSTYCGGDQQYFSLTILDSSGIHKTYNENMADGCWGDESDREYVNRSDIETLIELLPSNATTPDSSCETCIWKEDSQRIVLKSTDPSDDIPFGDYSKDTLPGDALEFLKTIKTTTEEKVYDAVDFPVYSITITSGSGLEQEYHDNIELYRFEEENRDEDWVYADRDDLAYLYHLIRIN